MLTKKQEDFCDQLKTMTNRSTGVRGLYHDSFTGYFTVRYPGRKAEGNGEVS